MTLVLRCEAHPGYRGDVKPGFEPSRGPREYWNTGSQSCRSCWELYRRIHEDREVRPEHAGGS